MRLIEIVQEYERFGAVKTLLDVALRGVNLFLTVKILKGVKIEALIRSF